MVKPVAGKLYVAAAFVLAGTSVVAARYVSDRLPPFAIAFLSLFFAVCAGAAFNCRETLRALGRITRQRWLYLFLQAFFGIFLFRVFLSYGLRHTTAAEAGIVTGAAPAVTAVIALLFLREPLSRRHGIGIAATLLGMLSLQGFPFETGGAGLEHLGGNLLVLCATAGEALFAVLSRKMHLADPLDKERLHPVSHATIVSVLALIMCVFPLCAEPAAAVVSAPVGTWLALVWYGAVVTIVAFACMFAGAKQCDGYTISAFTGLIPLSSLLLSILFLGEKVVYYQWLGCACILVSIAVLSGGNGRKAAVPD